MTPAKVTNVKLAVALSQEQIQDIKKKAEAFFKEDYWSDVSDVVSEVADGYDTPAQALILVEELVGAHSRVCNLELCVKTIEYSDFPNAAFCCTGTEHLDFRYGLPWAQLALAAFRKDIIKKLRERGLEVDEPKPGC